MKNIFALILLTIIASSCKKNTVEPIVVDPNISNVLILGNSITYSPADPAKDWKGNWGMAASAPEFDFVHLLTAKFKSQNPACQVTAENISVFEREYATYDFTADFKPFHDLYPDLIIIRIGENVQQAGIDAALFDKKYAALISYFKAGNPNVKILAAGSFWGNDIADNVMSRYSRFVSLKPLIYDNQYEAIGLYADASVALHPSDKGMQAIADMIWRGLSHL